MAKRAHYKTGPKKGQFKSGRRKTKRGGKKTRGKKRAAPKKRRSNPVAKKKKRRARRSGKRGRMTVKEKQNLGIASIAIGYLEENTQMLAKLPMATESGAKKNLIYGVALHYLAKQFKGDAGKWLDFGSAVYVVRAGSKFGAAKFQITGEGDAGAEELGADIYDATGHENNELSGDICEDG